MNLTVQEAEQKKSLRRMKAMATGLLLLMFIVFVLSHYYAPFYSWLAYVKAFSEAAMVGAIADWFAVTALFRHPLGVPIPHTAIVPKRKDEIGESLAGFIKENFLVADVLEPRVKEFAFANRLATWMSKEENAKRLTDDASGFSHWIFNAVDNQSIHQFLREHLHSSLREVKITPFIGRIFDMLTLRNRHQAILDMALRAAWEQLQKNKFKLKDKIDQESPWWLPSFVDKEIYNKISVEMEKTILRIGSDDHHEARDRFNEGLRDFIERLKEDPEMIAKGEELKNELLEHPSFQGYLNDIWTSMGSKLLTQMDDSDSSLRLRLQNMVQTFGEKVLETPELQDQINVWLNEATVYIVTHYRDEIGQIVSDTVKGWDPEVTSQRVELQVGRDLQFIRINGTLVGGIVGLLIYLFTKHAMV